MFRRPRHPEESPIVLPRWVITYFYSTFIALAIVAALVGIPSLDMTTPAGYVTPWAIAIGVTASIATWASRREALENIEKWSAVTLVAMLTVYVGGAIGLVLEGGEHAAGRGAFAVVLISDASVPLIRVLHLLSRTTVPGWLVKILTRRAGDR